MRNANLTDVVSDFINDKYSCVCKSIYNTHYINTCLKLKSGFTDQRDIDILKKEAADMIILAFEYFDISKTQIRVYLRTRPNTWVMFDPKLGISSCIAYRGITQIMDYEDTFFLCHNYEQNELKEIRIFGLNITDCLDNRNIKLNDNLLNNPEFQELKKNNFFGVKYCCITPFGPIRRINKLPPNTNCSFAKENIFDITLRYKNLSFEIEELLENFYVSGIGYYAEDENGNIEYRYIANANHPIFTIDVYLDELCPILKKYLTKMNGDN